MLVTYLEKAGCEFAYFGLDIVADATQPFDLDLAALQLLSGLI